MECKLEGCTNEVVRSTRGRPRLFCCPEHRVQYWNDQQARQGPSTRHSITDVDETKRVGTCSICGPVKVWRISDKYEDGRPRIRWVCATSRAGARVESRKRYDSSEKGRQNAMRHRYQMSAEELAVYMSKQTGRCDICGEEPKRLVLDHCHVAGGFRGWLCDPCNLMLGNAKDSPETLRAAAVYLEQYAVRQHGESHGKE